MIKIRILTLSAAALALAAMPTHAQEARSLDLTINDVGVSIGDAPRTIGLRMNFRDRNLEEVIGANVTIWHPYGEPTGVVRGLAVGLPVTGAGRIDGVGVGLLGVGANQSIRGIAAGGLGVGAGTDLRGISVAGLGVGAGRRLEGIGVGGLGVGAGQDLRGIAVGGLGAGIGEDMQGMAVGGLGVGVGRNATGILVGGVGAGVGGSMSGISLAGVGLGVGEDLTGIQVAGVGMGAGGTLRGISVAGVGIGAPRIEGFAGALAVGAAEMHGLAVAPAYLRIASDGRMRGVNVSAFNDVRGIQQGLAIGIFNYARVLDGFQLGLLNYAANKPRGTRLLPILNHARAR